MPEGAQAAGRQARSRASRMCFSMSQACRCARPELTPCLPCWLLSQVSHPRAGPPVPRSRALQLALRERRAPGQGVAGPCCSWLGHCDAPPLPFFCCPLPAPRPRRPPPVPQPHTPARILPPPPPPPPPPQAFALGNIIHEQLLSAYERELSASWVELDSSGRERRVSRLDDFTSQVGSDGSLQGLVRRAQVGGERVGLPACCTLPRPRLALALHSGAPPPCPPAPITLHSLPGPCQHAVVVCQPAVVPCPPAGAHHAGGRPQAAPDEPPGNIKLDLELRQVSRGGSGSQVAGGGAPCCLPCCSSPKAPSPVFLHPPTTHPPTHPPAPPPRFAYHPGPVMAQYQVEIGRRVPQFSGQSLTTTLWAMAALSVSSTGRQGVKGAAGGASPAQRSSLPARPLTRPAPAPTLPPFLPQATHCEGFVRLVERFVELERQGGFQVGTGRRGSAAVPSCRSAACAVEFELRAYAPALPCLFRRLPDTSALPCPALPSRYRVQDVQYNQVLQAVLLAQFEMQAQPGEFRPDIDLPDDIVDRALKAWQIQQQARGWELLHGGCCCGCMLPRGWWAGCKALRPCSSTHPATHPPGPAPPAGLLVLPVRQAAHLAGR